jgi:hypothetical protein
MAATSQSAALTTAAPELRQLRYNKVDIWSMGHITLEMLSDNYSWCEDVAKHLNFYNIFLPFFIEYILLLHLRTGGKRSL